MGDIYLKGIKYGGGSNVVPNPEGEATDTLSTIGIGNTIYDIAGSGGGGFKETILWSGNDSATMPLTEAIDSFDAILFVGNASDGGFNYMVSNIWSVQDINNHINDGMKFCAIANDAWYVYVTAPNTQTFTKQNQNILYISEIRGLNFEGGGSGTTSEIIPITAGDGTTSRTFTLRRTPKKVTLQGYTSGDGGWYESAYFIWGEDFMSLVGAQRTMATGGYAGQAAISYGADGKSFTITAANAFGAFNRSDNFSGMMLIDYGEGGTSDGSKDISDMTWTQIISQAGGSWSSATAIPSGTTYVALVVDYDNKAYMPQTFKLSDWDKYADTLSHSLVEWGFDWKVGSSYDTVQIEYDSANHTIRTYAGYSGLTLKTYALS